jgi:hypothetical protein
MESPKERVLNIYQEDGIPHLLHRALRKVIRYILKRHNVSLSKFGRVLRGGDIKGSFGNEIWKREIPPVNTLRDFHRTDSVNPFPESEDCEYIETYNYTYRNDFVFALEDVALLGPKGIGIDRDGRLIEDTISMPGQERVDAAILEAYLTYPLLTWKILRNPNRPINSAGTVSHACSLYSGWDNYYHWLVEHLPKLRAIEFYSEHTGQTPDIIVQNNPPDYIRESLDLMGVSEERIIEWNKPAMRIDTCVVPSYPEPSPSNLHWLRDNLAEVVPEKRSGFSKKLYISRSHAPKRKISNESATMDVLDKYKIERVYPERYSLLEQILMFKQSDLIIGPHGAGLTNMVWANDTTVIEIHNRYIRDHYQILSRNLGHRYIPVKGKSKHESRINSDITVDTSKIDEVLEQVLA